MTLIRCESVEQSVAFEPRGHNRIGGGPIYSPSRSASPMPLSTTLHLRLRQFSGRHATVRVTLVYPGERPPGDRIRFVISTDQLSCAESRHRLATRRGSALGRIFSLRWRP